MSRQSEPHWQLAAVAYEADLIDSAQLSRALSAWTEQPERSLLELLIEQDCLCTSDIPFLEALRQRSAVGKASTLNSVSQSTAASTPFSSTRFELNQDRVNTTNSLVSSIVLEVDQPLAQGGIGKVDIAVDSKLNRRVAMKRIQPKYALDFKARLRFAQEAEITGELEHPAIVPIYHYGLSESGEPFYSMRLIEGRTLREIISDGEISSIDFRRLLNGFITICRAVEHAHSKQIIHRDIKPANIIIGNHGEAMLVDWGLAKRLDRSQAVDDPQSDQDQSPHVQLEENDGELQLTVDGTSVGTPAYMSPEQAMVSPQVGKPSDIFGLGATLYFILTGRAPYTGQTSQEILAQAKSCDWRSIPTGAQVNSSLAAICYKAMSKNPADRYASAELLAEDLERWLGDEPVSAWRDNLATQTRRWIKRHRAASTGLAVSLLSLLAGSGAFAAYTLSVNTKLSQAYAKEQDARALAVEQGDLALQSLRSVTTDIQRKLQYVPAAQKVRARLLETALEGLSKVSASLAQRAEADQNLVIAHRDLGDLFLEVGNIGSQQGLDKAKIEFTMAESMAEKVCQQYPNDIENHRQLVLCQQRRASLSAIEGSTANALKIYEQAHQQLEKLHQQQSSNEQILRSLAISHNLIGDLQNRRGAIEQAGEHFQAGLKICEDQVARQVQMEDLERSQIVALNKVGGYLKRIGKIAEAENYFRKALTTSQARVDKQPDDFNALRDLSTAFSLVGQACQVNGRDDEALKFLQSSAEIDQRRFALDSANSLSGRDCVQSCNELATALRRVGNEMEASKQLQLAIDIGERVLKADSTDKRIIRDLAYSHSDLGDLLKEKQPDQALQQYENCLRLMQQSSKLDPENPRSKADIAFGLTKQADGFIRLSKYQQAITNLLEAVQLQKQRLEVSPNDVNSQSTLIEILQSLTDTLITTGQFDQARPVAEESVAATEKLTSQSPENYSASIALINSLQLLAKVEQATGHETRAKEKLQLALKLVQDLKQRGRLKAKDSDLEPAIHAELNKPK
ncbi:MAG: protein kinase [Pirellulales bacterium]